MRAADNAGLQLRAGLHAGEVELRGDDIGGLAVHVASRVSALAGADEVLVTGTVRDLVVGSGIIFDDRGRHDLKGVPGEWQILAVDRGPGTVSDPTSPRRAHQPATAPDPDPPTPCGGAALLGPVVAALVVTLTSGSSPPPTRSSTPSTTTPPTASPTTASAAASATGSRTPRVSSGPRRSRPALSPGSSPPRSPGRRSSPSGAGSVFSVACPPGNLPQRRVVARPGERDGHGGGLAGRRRPRRCRSADRRHLVRLRWRLAQHIRHRAVARATAGAGAVAGQLPQPRSDLATTTVGRTDYIVGGYDGTTYDPSVLATTDGTHFTSVANLPVPVRYPAVVALDGQCSRSGARRAAGRRRRDGDGGHSGDSIRRTTPPTSSAPCPRRCTARRPS